MTSKKQGKQLLIDGLIPLRNKHGDVIAEVLVDSKDFEWINKYRWSKHSNGHAVRSTTIKSIDKMIYLRREVLGVSNDKSVWVQSLNGPYDCRKQSLRIRTKHRDKQHACRLKKYGLTELDYESLLKKQHGVCAICKRPEAQVKKLAVDHCHDENKIRGLLCMRCNVGLGNFEDNPNLLKAALMYLQ